MRRLATALVLLAAPPAAAQDRPVFQPTRDVAVTYRVTGGPGGGQEIRMAWLTAAQRLRVDHAMGWSVLDQRGQRMLLVVDAQRMVVEMPAQAAAAAGGFVLPSPQPPDSARFTRAGQERIAGQACTLWHYEDGPTRGEACLTADGVMLRSRGSQGERSGAVEAVAVAYGPQDPARFEPPAGYRTMQLPAGLPPGTSPQGR